MDALTQAIGGTYTFVDGECSGYTVPVPIPEGEAVVLKTSSNDFFFMHQMPFFPRLAKMFINNIQYIVIVILCLFILLILIIIIDKKIYSTLFIS